MNADPPARNRQQVETSSSGAQEQTHSGHTPSPSSHESALCGLLALGASSVCSPGLHEAQASVNIDAQSVPLYALARQDKVSFDSERSGILRRSVLYRTETGSQSTLSLHSTGQNESNRPLCLHSGVSEDLGNFHDSSIPMPEGVSPDRSMPTGNSIELLKVYRYKIAPWLDICDSNQPFGVTLLIRLSVSPSLRAHVMRFAAAVSSIPWTEESSSITDYTLDTNEVAVVGVLEAASGMVPRLASWLSEDGKESREHLLGSVVSDLHSSDLKTSAYWLLVRLGKSHFQ